MKNTTLCYIECDGRILMLCRNKKKNDVNRGKWIGVGGKFEENESPEECLLREVYEETGIIPTSYRYRAVVTFVCDGCEGEYMHLFTAASDSTPVIPCSEGELAWIDKEELFSLNLWEGDRIFMELLGREEPFFSLKLTYKGDKLTEAILNGSILNINS